LARKLAQAGYTLILNARNVKDLVAAKNSLPSAAAVFVLAADVSRKSFAPALAKLMRKEKLSHLDIVVHSAAVNHMGTIRETRPENAELTFQVNSYSVITLAQATRIYLERATRPRFILVSSLMQYFAMPGRSIYAASKAAAEQFAGAWARELKAESSPIQVKIFRPAGIETGFHSNTRTDGISARSDISRMNAEQVAEYLFRFAHSGGAVMAPGFMNKVVAFVARHFPSLTAYLVGRRFRRRLPG
jgi:short-subunit dehydrogenase